jgi:hypothetical protein
MWSFGRKNLVGTPRGSAVLVEEEEIIGFGLSASIDRNHPEEEKNHHSLTLIVSSSSSPTTTDSCVRRGYQPEAN